MPLENSKQGYTGIDIAYNENAHRLPEFGPASPLHRGTLLKIRRPPNPAATTR